MNGANYQESGTAPLRSNPTDMHATVIPDPVNGPNRIPAKYQESGDQNLGGKPQFMTVAIQASKMVNKSSIPGTVSQFDGKSV